MNWLYSFFSWRVGSKSEPLAAAKEGTTSLQGAIETLEKRSNYITKKRDKIVTEMKELFPDKQRNKKALETLLKRKKDDRERNRKE